MKQQLPETQKESKQYLVALYERYAAMLLGYIFEIVKDVELAEKYVLNVFKAAAGQQHHFSKVESTWCRLQQIARDELAGFVNTIEDCANHSAPYINNNNSFINLMDEDQRNIFCAVYYHGKTIATLTKQLNKPEPIIRKTLKEAFAIIRNNGKH